MKIKNIITLALCSIYISGAMAQTVDDTQSQTTKASEKNRICTPVCDYQYDFAKKYNFAIKTNLLYWGLLAPNLGVEYYMSNHWSIGAEFAYTYLESETKDNRIKGWYAAPEIRYYLNSTDKNSGHYFNTKVNASHFNIMYNEDGRQGWLYGASLGYGYLVRLSKRLNFDFGLGLGVQYIDYDKYQFWPNDANIKDDEYLGSFKTLYWGVTDVRLGLTYRF